MKRSIVFWGVIVMGIVVSGCSGDGSGLDANGQPLSDSGPIGSDDAFTQVQAIFTSRCIVCHAGAAAPQGLILSEGISFDAIVNVPSNQMPNLNLIEPNDPDASYLVQKIRGDSGITGRQMPLNGPPFLTDEQINTVIDWVNDGAPPPSAIDPNAEFVSELSNFSQYRTWDEVDYSIGPTNIALAGIHQGDDLTFSRRVFSNPIAQAASSGTGDFPNGSILVKEVVTFQSGDQQFAEMGGLLAMVKRGGTFNPDNNGWEWFALSTDASEILARDADLAPSCNGCHIQAQSQEGGKDYVFAHPSEDIATDNTFANYQEWALIDDRNDSNPLLGSAHGAEIENSTRRVYQKQLYANPDQSYPIGTAIVKELLVEGEITEVLAMVKRGGSFNITNNFWEWFFLEAETGAIALDDNGDALRGADLMENGCNVCHSLATRANGEGIDYVFKHDGAPFNNNEEFFATAEDFENYLQWDNADYTIGDINIAIGGGHQGQENAYSRRTYINDVATQAEEDAYPRGSILVKEVTTWQSGEREFSPSLGLIAMVKRGGSFNTENNGWEWFELDYTTSEILGRGGDYRDNGCNNCHTLAEQQAGGGDYVFPHPSEFIAQSADFDGYQAWTQIDELSGANPLLGDAHMSDDLNAVRRVFKKQLYAAPEEEVFGFPIGTTIVKEITQEGEITELLAMVKRGGEFNADNQNWEWFLLNPTDASIRLDENNNELRGADLMEGGCNSCHAVAATGLNEGTDYVFFHENDPLNNGQ